MKLVWPDSFIEEVNLAQNISAVRKSSVRARAKIDKSRPFPARGIASLARCETALRPIAQRSLTVPRTSQKRGRLLFIAVCVFAALGLADIAYF
jgi:hypothetical protein